MFGESLLSSFFRGMEEGSVDTDSETTDTVDIVFTSRSNTPEGPAEVLEIRDPSPGNDEQFEVMVIEEDADNNDGENFEDETDPTVLLAVMDSMNTPLSDRYMDEFYDNINDIQDVCEADFQTYCNEGDATVTTMPNLMNLMNMRDSLPFPFINRRLDTKAENHAVESLERMADWVASLPHRMLTGPHGRVNKGPSVMPSYMKKHMYRKSKIDRGVALKKVTSPQTPKRKMLSDAFDHRDHTKPPPLFGKPPPKDGPPPKKGGPGPPRDGKPPPPFFGKPPPKGKPGSHYDSDSDSDSDDDDSFNNQDERCVHKLIMAYQGEDQVFEGKLGYGEAGDVCMYRNYNQLSSGCRQSIQTLFETRDDYWSDQQSITKHGHDEGHPGGMVLLLFLSFFMFLAVRHHGKMKTIRKILDVVDANPALKEQVETAAGVKIPVHGEGARTCSSYVWSAIRVVLMFAGLLFLSFFIAFSSIVIAIWICMALGHEDESGEMHYPSEFTGKCIWVVVLTLEVIAVVKFIKFLKRKCGGNRGDEPQSNGDVNAPPPNLYSNGPPMALNLPPSHGNNDNSGGSIYDYLPVFMRPGSPVTTDVYVPLSGEESSHGMRAAPAQEMTSIHSTTTTISAPTQQATAPQYYDNNHQRRSVYPGVIQGQAIGQVRMV